MRPCESPRACVRRRHQEEPPPHRRWYRRRLSFTVAHGVDGAIDDILIDSPALSHPLRMGGFLAPLLVLLLCEELVENEAIFLGKLLDLIKDLVDGCAAHKSSERHSTKCKASSSGISTALGSPP